MIVTFGEPLLRLTAPGREALLRTASLETCFGGAEANVAVALAHLGAPARFASVLPGNPLGEAALGEFRRHGVDTAAIARVPGRLGLYFLATGAGSRASQVTYDRAGSAFAAIDPEAIDWPTALAGAAWLHLSGVTLAVSAAAEGAARRAVEVAVARGVRISFDGNFRQQLWDARGGNPGATIDWFLAHADLAFANDRDLSLVTGDEQDGRAPFERTAEAFFARYPSLSRLAATQRDVESHDRQTLVGRMATRGSGVVASSAWALDSIVDRIGSGDAFAAGVLHGLTQVQPDDEIITFATALGALKHTLPGDFCTLTVEDVRAAMGGGHDVRR